MTDIAIRHVPLDRLRFGHDATPPINARRSNRTDEIESLAASISAHGLGQALNVREIDGEIFVVDGNRRLAALRLLADRNGIVADAAIKCDFDATAEGDELSLALNIERLPMHEADTYEAFHDLQARGLTEDQIAGRFGIEPRRVKRMLALGRLHPEILDAWRNNELGNRTVETVRMFTLAASIEHQAEVFRRLKQKGDLYPHLVRDALGVGDRDLAKLMTFVGRDAYLAAGGVMVEDLFGDDHRIDDPAVLRKLADEKVQATLEALRADGWSWAELTADLPEGWRWNWRRLHPDEKAKPTKDEKARLNALKKIVGDAQPWERDTDQIAAAREVDALEDAVARRGFTAEQRALAGAAVEIGLNGELNIQAGYVKANPKAQDKPKKETPPSGLSNAVMTRLSTQLTLAAQDALAADGRIALAALLAGLAAKGSYGQPVRLQLEGLHARDGSIQPFAETLTNLLEHPTERLVDMLGAALAPALNLQSFNAFIAPLDIQSNNALANALLPGPMNEALRKQFDADDYFKSVARPLTLKAIEEALNADESRKAAKLKKAELVTFALANVAPTGWLPPELRTAHYDGPGAHASAPELEDA
jgi:ParB family transcriptional regulator, chromosome partitioning protein